MSLESFSPGARPEEVSAALFDGALIVFRDVAPVLDLVRRVRSIVEDIFATAHPEEAEARMEPAPLRKAIRRARQAVEQDEAANQAWREALEAIGYSPDAMYLDRVRLRVVPSRKEVSSRVIRPLPAHRDTWGSGIMAQVNWWLPLYPLAPTRTMRVWPEAFRSPIENDSGTWDYEAFRERSNEDYPLLPLARAAPEGLGLPILIEPGAVLAFSAAHLHASATDASARSRFTIDTRTVWADDARAGRGAPNVDGAARRARWEWFRPGGSYSECQLP